jgi:hypothetical protein
MKSERPHQNPSFDAKPSEIPLRLQNALEYVLNTCVLGTTNKLDDVVKTSGWVLFQTNRYGEPGQYRKLLKEEKLTSFDMYANPKYDQKSEKMTHDVKEWYYKHHQEYTGMRPDVFLLSRIKGLDPLKDPTFRLNKCHEILLQDAMLASEKRQGNCGERSALIMKYLWEHSAGINRIEMGILATVHHCVVIVNRSECSNLHDSTTWGNAWVIDAWFGDKGIIFHASEFKDKIKKIQLFSNQQFDQQKKIGYHSPRTNKKGEEKLAFSCNEILPAIHHYPTYSTSPFLPIEYYYHILNIYTKDLTHNNRDLSVLLESKKAHEYAFKTTLEEVTKKQRSRQMIWNENKSTFFGLPNTVTDFGLATVIALAFWMNPSQAILAAVCVYIAVSFIKLNEEHEIRHTRRK